MVDKNSKKKTETWPTLGRTLLLALAWSALMLGVLLRAVFLLREDAWYDEAWSIYVASLDWNAMLSWLSGDIHPYLYHIFIKYATAPFGGPSLLSVRLVSLSCGVLAILSAGYFCRFLEHRIAPSALVAMAVLAWMPNHLHYSMEARMYAPAGLLLFVASGGWLVIWQRRPTAYRWVFFLLGPLAAASAISFHYVTAIQLTIFGLIVAPWRGCKFQWRDWLLYWGAGAVLALPTVIELAWRLHSIHSVSGWMPYPSFPDLLRSVSRLVFLHNELSFARDEAWWQWLLDASSLLLLVWALSGLTRLSRKHFSWVAPILTTFIVAHLLQWTLTRVGLNVFFWPRYGSLLFPLLAMAAGPLVVALWERSLFDRAVIVAVLMVGFGSSTHYSIHKSHPHFGPVRHYLDTHPEQRPLYVFGSTAWAEYIVNLGEENIEKGSVLFGNDTPNQLLLVVNVIEGYRPPEEVTILSEWLPQQETIVIEESEQWTLLKVLPE